MRRLTLFLCFIIFLPFLSIADENGRAYYTPSDFTSAYRYTEFSQVLKRASEQRRTLVFDLREFECRNPSQLAGLTVVLREAKTEGLSCEALIHENSDASAFALGMSTGNLKVVTENDELPDNLLLNTEHLISEWLKSSETHRDYSLFWSFDSPEISTFSPEEAKAFILSSKPFPFSFLQLISVFIGMPLFFGIVISVFLLGLYFEITHPGTAYGGVTAFAAFVIIVGVQSVNGNVQVWELCLLTVCLGLILFEVFVFSGGGIIGGVGILGILTGFTLLMLNNEGLDFGGIHYQRLIHAALTATASVVTSFALMVYLLLNFHNSSFLSSFALQSSQSVEAGFVSSPKQEVSIEGSRGIAYSVLRPGGKVEIEGRVFDAWTRGEFISKGTSVLVIKDEGSRLRVRAV